MPDFEGGPSYEEMPEDEFTQIGPMPTTTPQRGFTDIMPSLVVKRPVMIRGLKQDMWNFMNHKFQDIAT